MQNGFYACCKVLDPFRETNIKDSWKMAGGTPAPNPN